LKSGIFPWILGYSDFQIDFVETNSGKRVIMRVIFYRNRGNLMGKGAKLGNKNRWGKFKNESKVSVGLRLEREVLEETRFTAKARKISQISLIEERLGGWFVDEVEIGEYISVLKVEPELVWWINSRVDLVWKVNLFTSLEEMKKKQFELGALLCLVRDRIDWYESKWQKSHALPEFEYTVEEWKRKRDEAVKEVVELYLKDQV